jgi:glycerol kinase
MDSQQSEKSYILTIDQGTTSSRVLMIDHNLKVIDVEQREHRQIALHPGWCEHDPEEIFANVKECIEVISARNNLSKENVKAIAITNQRETVVPIDRTTGKALHNAIVWLDKRTAVVVAKFEEKLKKEGKDLNAYREICGLPVNTYFSGVKMRWLIEHCAEVNKAHEEGNVVFGTVDTWLIYVSIHFNFIKLIETDWR